MNYCFQYEKRLLNLDEDLRRANLTKEETSKLKVSDFEFEFVDKVDKERCQEIKNFIIRHEWLGKMPHRPTHRFIATYKGFLAGVVIMATPNAFSFLLGKENKDKEKLISRGACISWSPKNLASSLVMFSVRWMVKNTNFRFFSAYSDTRAGELGVIYQACNFIYLGQNSGAKFEYFDPASPEKGFFGDRIFRKISSYKKYALELGIDWQEKWNHKERIIWRNIPEKIKEKLKERAKLHQESCQRRETPRKHKYVCILGRDKKESKALLEIFRKNNPKKVDLPYPKIRGDSCGHPKRRPLTERPSPCWPLKRRYYSIKEVSQMYGISTWVIYHHIKTDPSFPFVNIGVRKRYLVDGEKFEKWLNLRGQMETRKNHQLPNTNELMEVENVS